MGKYLIEKQPAPRYALRVFMTIIEDELVFTANLRVITVILSVDTLSFYDNSEY